VAIGKLYDQPGDFGFIDWADFQKSPEDCTPGKIIFALKQPLWYIDKTDTLHILERGYLSDLGSIPRFLWPIIPPHQFPSAYYLHDFYCDDPETSRLYGDRLLLEALEASGADLLTRMTVYRAVRTYAIVMRIK